MQNGLMKKEMVLVILLLCVGTSVVPLVSGTTPETSSKEIELERNPTASVISEVWVDDDYYEGGYNEGHTWGYDAFDDVQEGIDHVDDFGTVHVNEGIYDVFIIEGRNALDILGEDEPIITGNQLAYDLSYPSSVNNVVFVNNSYNICLEGFLITGTDPTPTSRDFTIFFQNSNGEIQNCTIDANSIENMNGIAVRAILESSLTISHCLIKDYGRIAAYAKTGTILRVFNCTLIGQTYNQINWVNYGIEIEGLDDACLGIVKGNDIYHHNNTQTAAWSSAGVIVDYWRYYGPDNNCLNSTVLIENNRIYDNMHGVQIVPNENIEVTYNEFHDNGYGAISEPWYDGSAYHNVGLHAEMNWWGDPSGPYHPTENPDGLGDEVYGDVLFTPWITDVASNITCEGSLQWNNVAPGGTVTGSFMVENTGYVYSDLSWEVDETPAWGIWTFTPENGSGLTPGMGQITVHVSVIAPLNKNKKFTGTLKIINSEDPSDYCEIDISLKTPTTIPVHSNVRLIQWFFERFPNAFPHLRQLMGY